MNLPCPAIFCDHRAAASRFTSVFANRIPYRGVNKFQIYFPALPDEKVMCEQLTGVKDGVFSFRSELLLLQAGMRPSSGCKQNLEELVIDRFGCLLLGITPIRLHPVAGLHWHQCWRYDQRIGAGHSMMTVTAK